ncbi:MAG: molybdopterin molybdenumtransferase MoeA [Thermoprotei archaeon]|nr:MAG: molybdopterin molybdenumtransferase MoeA [Thermoprotei archaeon]
MFKLVSLEEAQERLKKFKLNLGVEVVHLRESLGRVLARDVHCNVALPPFNRSSRDGYAVKAEDTFVASDQNPARLLLIGSVSMGMKPSIAIGRGECAYIPTGAPLPRGANAVVMVEDVKVEDNYVYVYRPVAPLQNVVTVGSDVPKGSLIAKKGAKIGVREVALLASSGYKEVEVFEKPLVAVLSTGLELVDVGLPLDEGKVYDVNSYVLSSYLTLLGCRPILMGIAPDDPLALSSIIEKALSLSHFTIVSGGTSKGEGDVLPQALDLLIKRLGGSIVFHGLSLKPGKPTLLADIGGKLVFGLPGNPTSTLTVFEKLVKPWLLENTRWGRGFEEVEAEAVLAKRVLSFEGRREVVYVKLQKNGDALYAHPLLKGSEAVSTFVFSDGYLEVGEDENYVEEGTTVRVRLLKLEGGGYGGGYP